MHARNKQLQRYFFASMFVVTPISAAPISIFVQPCLNLDNCIHSKHVESAVCK